MLLGTQLAMSHKSNPQDGVHIPISGQTSRDGQSEMPVVKTALWHAPLRQTPTIKDQLSPAILDRMCIKRVRTCTCIRESGATNIHADASICKHENIQLSTIDPCML